jgi:hypothetical protein
MLSRLGLSSYQSAQRFPGKIGQASAHSWGVGGLGLGRGVNIFFRPSRGGNGQTNG